MITYTLKQLRETYKYLQDHSLLTNGINGFFDLLEFQAMGEHEEEKTASQPEIKVEELVAKSEYVESAGFCDYFRCKFVTKSSPVFSERHNGMFYHKECLKKQKTKEWMHDYNKRKNLKEIKEPFEAVAREHFEENPEKKTHTNNFGSGKFMPTTPDAEYAYCASPKCPKPFSGKYVAGTGVNQMGLTFCSQNCADSFRPIRQPLSENELHPEILAEGEEE